jgi:hypothetical protein
MYRAYSPTLGRWLSRDPVDNPTLALMNSNSSWDPRVAVIQVLKLPAELVLGPNLYEMVGNDPVKFVDRSGLIDSSSCPCSGPPGGKAGLQDNICSVPGGSLLAGLEGDTGITKCCHQHDDCYIANGCNYYSWRPRCGSEPCKQCNTNVRKCVVSVIFDYSLAASVIAGWLL